MSDTESFEYAIKVMRENLTGMYDNGHMTSWANVDTSVDLELIQKAHDREIRDTAQREYHRGYEDAMHARATATWQLDQERMEIVRGLREFRCEDIEPWFEMQFWTLLRLLGVESEASTPADCDDVAHLRDRLIHLLGGDSNSPNSCGCSANNLQKSPNSINKDAEPPSYFTENADFNKLGERKATISKLERLQFDGGSHENLSKIAFAIYPCATGWTCESAAGLRDKLIELMGGVNGSQHMERRSDAVMCDGAVSGRDATGLRASDACGDSAGGRVVSDDMSREGEIGLADDSRVDVDCGDSGLYFHFDGVTYDVLGNERHKAVCELRKLPEWYKDDGKRSPAGRFNEALGDAIGVEGLLSFVKIRDRLIHLLGGDKPSGIDVLREADEPTLSDLWGVWKDADGTCPNNVPISSITDKLRECIDTATKTYDDTPWHEMNGDSNADHTICYVTEGELMRIADRIDEQFDRICQQQEAVLQSTIDGAAQRLKDADKRLDEAAHDAEMWHDRSEDMRMERDATLAELNARNDTDAVTQLYRLLKSTLGEAKCIRDRLVAQSDLNHKVKAYADRCRDDCRMYREMLNDAAKEYADLKAERDALCDDFEPDEEDFDQFLRDVLEDL